jgi:hypothetical protein
MADFAPPESAERYRNCQASLRDKCAAYQGSRGWLELILVAEQNLACGEDMIGPCLHDLPFAHRLSVRSLRARGPHVCHHAAGFHLLQRRPPALPCVGGAAHRRAPPKQPAPLVIVLVATSVDKLTTRRSGGNSVRQYPNRDGVPHRVSDSSFSSNRVPCLWKPSSSSRNRWYFDRFLPKRGRMA